MAILLYFRDPSSTKVYRQYCKDEFIKDTDELLECINAFNLESLNKRLHNSSQS